MFSIANKVILNTNFYDNLYSNELSDEVIYNLFYVFCEKSNIYDLIMGICSKIDSKKLIEFYNGCKDVLLQPTIRNVIYHLEITMDIEELKDANLS